MTSILYAVFSTGCVALQPPKQPPSVTSTPCSTDNLATSSTGLPSTNKPSDRCDTSGSGKPSIADWIEKRDRQRMSPELDALAEQIADLDRADPGYNWSALRHIKNQYNLFNPTPRSLLVHWSLGGRSNRSLADPLAGKDVHRSGERT